MSDAVVAGLIRGRQCIYPIATKYLHDESLQVVNVKVNHRKITSRAAEKQLEFSRALKVQGERKVLSLELVVAQEMGRQFKVRK